MKKIEDLEEIAMKTRITSALLALLIFIPIFIDGGLIFDTAIFIVAMLGLKEFLDVKESKKELPIFIKLVSYMMMALILLSGNTRESIYFAIDFRVVAGLFLIYLVPTVLYHDTKRYSIVDAFELIGGVFFLGIAFHLFLFVRHESLALIIYLFLISIFTDTFAFIGGMLIGKTKLLESISPKKTVEGMIIGSLMGVMISVWFYITVIDVEASYISIIITSLFLSILGQFGDLVFSAIKRYYGKKDFSNIMPGHGGILDRLDSIIFILLSFMFFMTII